MRILILGCGTSTGVPVIGCDCGVCTSTDPRNVRTRSSVLLGAPGGSILIDTSTDLRAQCLANSVERVDAVLLTHTHADHVNGMDELRVFNRLQQSSIPCYGSAQTVGRISVIFDYIFDGDDDYGWRPDLSITGVDAPFIVCGVEVVPLKLKHAAASIFGYRIGDVAYLTDCSGVPDSSMKLLGGLKLLIIGALRKKPHPSHFSIDQAIEVSRRCTPERTILTHLGHSIDYVRDGDTLPGGVELAYDTMVVEL